MLGRERDKSFCSTFFHLRFLTCFWGVRQTNRYLSVAFSGLKIGMKFTSKTVFLPLFTTARTLFCLFFANAKLVKIFRIRKKYSLRLEVKYNPQIQISAESETKRSIFREKDKTKRSKKESAQHSKSRNKSFVMTSVSAL